MRALSQRILGSSFSKRFSSGHFTPGLANSVSCGPAVNDGGVDMVTVLLTKVEDASLWPGAKEAEKLPGELRCPAVAFVADLGPVDVPERYTWCMILANMSKKWKVEDKIPFKQGEKRPWCVKHHQEFTTHVGNPIPWQVIGYSMWKEGAGISSNSSSAGLYCAELDFLDALDESDGLTTFVCVILWILPSGCCWLVYVSAETWNTSFLKMTRDQESCIRTWSWR